LADYASRGPLTTRPRDADPRDPGA